jgi:hypothetical protein
MAKHYSNHDFVEISEKMKRHYVAQFFIIQKMMRGMFRLDKRHDCRKPITLKILIKLTEALNEVCFSVYESVTMILSKFLKR